MNKPHFIYLLSVCTLLLASCGNEPKQPGIEANTKPKVFTTFYPLQYFAERLAGSHATVICPLPTDADPITWQPDNASIVAFQNADALFTNGAGFEKWLSTVNLPAATTHDTSQGFADQFVHYEDATTHSHGPDGDHAHEGLDGHTWLNPLLAQKQVRAMFDVLQGIEEIPSENYTSLSNDLQQVADELDTVPIVPLLASHPAYNYIRAQWNWNITNLDLDPAIVPDAESIASIQAHPAKIMLWESQPAPEVVAALAPKQCLVCSPCETPPEEGDYLSVMQANIQRLKDALK